MPTTIPCCYRGCSLDAWRPVDGRLEVARSCATCLECRRVALCLAHFGEVRLAQGDLQCPNCSSTRWRVILFEGESLPRDLHAEVELRGGRVERRAGAHDDRQLTRPLDRILPLARTTPPEDPWPSSLRLVRRARIGQGARLVGAGVIARDANEVWVLGTDRRFPFDRPVREAEVSRGQRALAATLEGDARCPTEVRWIDEDGVSARLPNPLGGATWGARFTTPDRVLYVENHDGGHTLREARRDDGVTRTRRLGRAERLPDDVGPLPFDRGRSALLFRVEGQRVVPCAVSLRDGRAVGIAAPQPPPAAVAVAVDSGVGFWVTQDGELRCAGTQLPERLLGRARGALPAVSPDGKHVAWYAEGELTLRDLGNGETQSWPAGDDVVGLSWG